MMQASKVESHCTVLRSDNWALGRSSGSHIITMKFIPNNLVRQVTFSSTTDVTFPRFSCTHVITTKQQYKKNSSIGDVMRVRPSLSLSSGTFPSLLVTFP